MTARRVHNGLVDKRPALIARCAGVADVVPDNFFHVNVNVKP